MRPLDRPLPRRQVLKLMAALAVAAAVPLGVTIPVVAEAMSTVAWNGALYRIHEGAVHVSVDQGETWQLHTAFGPDLPARELALDDAGRLHATLDYRRWSFGLQLADDARTWITA